MPKKTTAHSHDWIPAREARRLHGGSRSAFYRAIDRRKEQRTLPNAAGEAIEVWVITEWGAIKWPESEWQFCATCLRAFIDRALGG